MTNDQVKSLKVGDKFVYFWVIGEGPMKTGRSECLTVKRIVDRHKSEKGYWAIVETEEVEDKKIAIESDEYLLALGFQVFETSTPGYGVGPPMPMRRLGAELL